MRNYVYSGLIAALAYPLARWIVGVGYGDILTGVLPGLAIFLTYITVGPLTERLRAYLQARKARRALRLHRTPP